MVHAFEWIQEILKIIQVMEIYQVSGKKESCNGNRNRNFCRVEYNVEIVDDQVILVARKQDLEKLERTKIPDNLIVDAKPVVAIIGGGAGKSVFPNGVVN